MGSNDSWVVVLLLLISLFLAFCFEKGISTSVSYDGRALVVDGKRRILQSGSIHYPRAMPEVWPEIIRKSKEGGLDVIETYVFWNYHEPVRGQYYFEGRFDLVKFIKTVHEAGLFVHLRIGPYACAEWNYGGFPFWLHQIPGIQFRTTNKQYQDEMERFITKIVDLMKEENLFAPQGGPVILAQVENEYGNVEWAYGIGGELYVKWAADTAINLNTSVPWINTCNGFYCDGFTPNSPSKPAMWTENYSGWFLSFGYAVPYRPVEDLAFAVARFFERGGTFQNYYMYFGGTNFGRTAGGPLIATSYDYDAPLDEYGYIRQPKWGHLRNLHMAIKHCEEYLVSAEPTQQSLGKNLEAHVYYKSSNDCAAFIANFDSVSDANVTFNGNTYFLPAWSVSILPDCEHVIFNTAKVDSHKNLLDASRSLNTDMSEISLPSSAWSWYKEKVGISDNSSFTASELLEHINTTKDVSDFLWYTTSINVDGDTKKRQEENLHLLVTSLGHAALVFVNKKLVGFGYGNHDEPSFALNKKIELNDGTNSLEMLSIMVGLQNYGPWFDVSPMGISSVILSDLKGSKQNLSSTEWTYQVGVEGEHLGLSNTILVNSSLWSQGNVVPTKQSLIWYKTTFLAPSGAGPISLDLSSMGKGEAWVNGQSIGRYWPAYLAPSTGCTENCDYRGAHDSNTCLKYCGEPAQTLYHIPRSWVHSGANVLVLHEELSGDPTKISFSTRTGQEICAHVAEDDLPPIDTWKPNEGFTSHSPEIRLSCERGWRISSVSFASFGTPQGHCGNFTPGRCHIDVLSAVEQVCVGKQECPVPVTTQLLGNPCPGLTKSLAIQALCTMGATLFDQNKYKKMQLSEDGKICFEYYYTNRDNKKAAFISSLE